MVWLKAPFFRIKHTKTSLNIETGISLNHMELVLLWSHAVFILITQILDDIHDRFGHLLETLVLVWLDPGIFSQVIHVKGAPLNQCWGFIDGTPRPMARPTRNQKIMYSGHKRTHCIKFQVQQHAVHNMDPRKISLP